MVPRGETRWIHLTGLALRDAAGKPVRWTGSVADITERKGAEDALRLSEHRYALAMEATGDGHWDWDIATDKMYVSPLLLEMCGLPADITFANRAEWVDRFRSIPANARDTAEPSPSTLPARRIASTWRSASSRAARRAGST
jgi:PAS domain-containing protein